MLQLSVTPSKGEGRVRVGYPTETIPHLSPLGPPSGRDPEGEAEYERAMALAICKRAPLPDD